MNFEIKSIVDSVTEAVEKKDDLSELNLDYSSFKGKLIVLEAGELTNKSEIICNIIKKIKKNVNVLGFSEFSYKNTCKYLSCVHLDVFEHIIKAPQYLAYEQTVKHFQELISNTGLILNDTSLMLLFTTLRSVGTQLIKYLLNKGYFILLDRGWDTPLVYQCLTGNASPDLLLQAKSHIWKNVHCSLSVLLTWDEADFDNLFQDNLKNKNSYLFDDQYSKSVKVNRMYRNLYQSPSEYLPEGKGLEMPRITLNLSKLSKQEILRKILMELSLNLA